MKEYRSAAVGEFVPNLLFYHQKSDGRGIEKDYPPLPEKVLLKESS
ncbi:MAG: hypothetical protein N2170_02665 [Bacteroidia bacterium]|nr:hypothetical protein [Bacteroidia bacterium]